MALNRKDLETIEKLIHKHSSNLAVSFAHSFEQLKESIYETEARFCSRMAEIKLIDEIVNKYSKK
jgi:hypothetical protein